LCGCIYTLLFNISLFYFIKVAKVYNIFLFFYNTNHPLVLRRAASVG